MQTALHVKTAVYEGPLDLLLELIEKRKLFINDISLATVTDEYIERVSAMAEMPVGDTAEFVALAAMLLLIKSRSLLPTLTISEEESRDIKELEYRLALYQLLKEHARALIAGNRPPLWEGRTPEPEPLFLFDDSISLQSLRTSAQTLIDGFPKATHLPKVEVKKIVSIEEVIEQLAHRVSNAFRMSFSEFTKHSAGERHAIIVSFLALLELVKQGIIKANQSEQFSDIMLEADSVTTPTYE